MWVTKLGCFVVQAASPRLGRLEWQNKGMHVSRYILKPWSLVEALAASVDAMCWSTQIITDFTHRRMLQTHQQPSERELKIFFERHISSARAAYNFASDIQTHERHLTQQLSTLSLQNVLKALTAIGSFQIDDDLPHQIFVILPNRDRSEHVIQFASQHWVDIVVAIVKKDKIAAAAQELFEVFIRNPFTRGAAGQLLDSVVGDIFARGGAWKIQEMKKSPRLGSKNRHWKIRRSWTHTNKWLIIGYPGQPPVVISEYPPKDNVFQQIQTRILPSTSTDSVVLHTGYYLPASQTEATFDSFYYEADIKQATVLQLTVSNQHSMKTKGLKRLEGLGVERVRYVAVTGPLEYFDLPVPNEYEYSPFLKEKYHLVLDNIQ